MHIQASTTYLELINQGLMNVIAPQIEDEQGRAVIAMLQGALKELYKREQRTPGLLMESNTEGLAIAKKLQALASGLSLEEAGDADEITALSACIDGGSSTGFSALRTVNNRLNVLITTLGNRLSRARGNEFPREQQDEIAELLRSAADWDFRFQQTQREAIQFADFRLRPHPGGSDVTTENLQEFIARQPGREDTRVSNLIEIPGGMAKHTYACTLSSSDGSAEDVIIRKEDIHPLWTQWAFNVAAEFELLRLVSDAGFNAPKPLILAKDEPAFDSNFYVMTRRPGVVAGNFFGPLIEMDESLLLDIAVNMARLHSIDIQHFKPYFDRFVSPEILAGDIKDAYRFEIEWWRRYLEETATVPSPACTFTWDWLLENIPDNHETPVLVHGDFNVHNFLVADNRISAVLDWELALAGDPAQDLAYIKPNIEKLIDWDRFMQTYYEHGGREIDESTFGYYIAFANAKPLTGALRNMELMRTAQSDDIRFTYMDTDFVPQFIQNILGHVGPV